MTTFVLRSSLPVPVRVAWDWHMRPGAFERLSPPWTRPRMSRVDPVRPGGRVEFSMSIAGPVRTPWVSECVEVKDGELFKDVQRAGPFARFEHIHAFVAGDAGSFIEDWLDYALPFGPLGGIAVGAVDRRLRAAFAYRHRVLRGDLEAHAAAPGPSLRILVTGADGLIGRALVAFLTTGGHEVVRVVRRPAASPHEIEFDPESGARSPSELEGFDAVVHLAGASIAGRRWSEAWKREIRDSRVVYTRRLAETLAALRRPPATFVSASAVGYYGNRDDRALRESDPPGQGFLPDVAAQWEAATEAARSAGIRVVLLRTGVVLTPLGGALREMLPPFGLGAGGPVGSGSQWWSWIAIDDLLYLVLHALRTRGVAGPINATSPEPVRNADFARTLGRVLRRPAIVPAPAFALRALLGEMAGPLLCDSARALPEKVLDAGFRFRYPSLEGALRHVLGRDWRVAARPSSR